MKSCVADTRESFAEAPWARKQVNNRNGHLFSLSGWLLVAATNLTKYYQADGEVHSQCDLPVFPINLVRLA